MITHNSDDVTEIVLMFYNRKQESNKRNTCGSTLTTIKVLPYHFIKLSNNLVGGSHCRWLLNWLVMNVIIFVKTIFFCLSKLLLLRLLIRFQMVVQDFYFFRYIIYYISKILICYSFFLGLFWIDILKFELFSIIFCPANWLRLRHSFDFYSMKIDIFHFEIWIEIWTEKGRRSYFTF